jgi:hypothetical protein
MIFKENARASLDGEDDATGCFETIRHPSRASFSRFPCIFSSFCFLTTRTRRRRTRHKKKTNQGPDLLSHEERCRRALARELQLLGRDKLRSLLARVGKQDVLAALTAGGAEGAKDSNSNAGQDDEQEEGSGTMKGGTRRGAAGGGVLTLEDDTELLLSVERLIQAGVLEPYVAQPCTRARLRPGDHIFRHGAIYNTGLTHHGVYVGMGQVQWERTKKKKRK